MLTKLFPPELFSIIVLYDYSIILLENSVECLEYFSQTLLYLLPDIKNKILDHLLRYASKSSLVSEKIKILLKNDHKSRFVKDSYYLIYFLLITAEYTDIIKYILENRIINVSYTGYILELASNYGYSDIVEFMLRYQKFDTNVLYNSLSDSAENGHIETVKLILEKDDINLSYNNNYIIKTASLNGYTDIVLLLLRDHRLDTTDLSIIIE